MKWKLKKLSEASTLCMILEGNIHILFYEKLISCTVQHGPRKKSWRILVRVDGGRGYFGAVVELLEKVTLKA